jgi:hypothetical protein
VLLRVHLLFCAHKYFSTSALARQSSGHSIFTRFAENGAGSNCQRLLSVIDAFPLPDVPLVQFRIKAPDVGFWGAKQKSSARLDHCRFLTRGLAD